MFLCFLPVKNFWVGRQPASQPWSLPLLFKTGLLKGLPYKCLSHSFFEHAPAHKPAKMEATLDQASNQEKSKNDLADLLRGIERAQEEFFNCLDCFAKEFDIEIEILDKAATLAEELSNLNGILHKHKLL